MANVPLIRTLVKAMGFCCTFAFIRSVRGLTKPRIAGRLGVHAKAIQYWRRSVKEGRCQCTESEGCALQRFKDYIPRVPLSSLRERSGDPFVE